MIHVTGAILPQRGRYARLPKTLVSSLAPDTEFVGALSKEFASMTKTTLKAIAMTALIGTAALILPLPAEAGNGNAVGAGLLGFGIGAIVGSAIAPREVYVGPPPPAYYGPVAYGPPPWTPEWYSYCAQTYRSFNSHTGYFIGYDGQPYFCQ
jgi:BA14K-like protein